MGAVYKCVIAKGACKYAAHIFAVLNNVKYHIRNMHSVWAVCT